MSKAGAAAWLLPQAALLQPSKRQMTRHHISTTATLASVILLTLPTQHIKSLAQHACLHLQVQVGATTSALQAALEHLQALEQDRTAPQPMSPWRRSQRMDSVREYINSCNDTLLKAVLLAHLTAATAQREA
jgi:hypothetical protein